VHLRLPLESLRREAKDRLDLNKESYNTAVVLPQSQKDAGDKRHRHAIYATETSGLLLIVLIVLIVTVIRYWHAIHWSMR
jgi:hypothetical protein